MHKPRQKDETFIGARWLANELGVSRKMVWYYAIKLRLRFFKFKGRRYIEVEDSFCLIERLRFQYGLDVELVNDVIVSIKNL